MAQDNQVVIVGNLTRDPELRYTPNGAALVKFGVAVSRRVKDDATGQWKDAETSFFDVTAWRSLAENVAETLAQRIQELMEAAGLPTKLTACASVAQSPRIVASTVCSPGRKALKPSGVSSPPTTGAGSPVASAHRESAPTGKTP